MIGYKNRSHFGRFFGYGDGCSRSGNGDSIALSTNVHTSLPALAPAAYRGHFWRVDAENDAGLPRNFRTCQSSFHGVEHKYASEVDPSYIPSRKGLTTCVFPGPASFRPASSTPSSMSCGKDQGSYL